VTSAIRRAASKMMWKSKLGTEYSKDLIDRLDAEHHRTLKQLRTMPENRCCADCKAPESNWASVNLGIFLCTRCASVHRGLGTHVSKTKSCMGTYLWGPDEIARMRAMGNAKAARVYLGKGKKPPTFGPDVEHATLFDFAQKKYEKRLWAVPESEGKADDAAAKAEADDALVKTEGFVKAVPKQLTSPATEKQHTLEKPPRVAAHDALKFVAPAALQVGSSTKRVAASTTHTTPAVASKPSDSFFDDFFDSLFDNEEKKPLEEKNDFFTPIASSHGTGTRAAVTEEDRDPFAWIFREQSEEEQQQVSFVKQELSAAAPKKEKPCPREDEDALFFDVCSEAGCVDPFRTAGKATVGGATVASVRKEETSRVIVAASLPTKQAPTSFFSPMEMKSAPVLASKEINWFEGC